jgi:hypothetical protein
MEKQDRVDFQTLSTSVEVGHGGKAKKLGEGLDDALAEVARAVKRVGGKGTISLKLSVKSEGNGSDVLVEANMITKVPELKTFPIRAYVDRRGNLVADDPEQPAIPGLKSVKNGGAEE